MTVTPTLRFERALLREGFPSVLCVDEVGRGALAGPVVVGVVLVEPGTPTGPAGLRDSKDLTAAARTRLEPRVRRWAPELAIGAATAAEIDRVGILPALRLATHRAIARIAGSIGVILLDGSHDWLSDRDHLCSELPGQPAVVTRVKADRSCTGVAAASVVAKVARDAHMLHLADLTGDRYGWRTNKGYSSRSHTEALLSHGPGALHRRSWQLPGTGGDPDRVATAAGRPQRLSMETRAHVPVESAW